MLFLFKFVVIQTIKFNYMHYKLREARLDKGYSQSTLGKKIGLEQTTYSRKERGVSVIRSEEWNRLAKALSLTVEEIKEVDNLVKENSATLPHEVLQSLFNYIQKLQLENENLKNRYNFK